ncbi:hypothetical protein Ae201684P_018471 [Aphanomyces euteiches]|uniref:Uncharacterized protein n=1 Tax=Aphanomyces euteiches TaxID=100861 RepID=A0A6G0XUY8_9STRA|nr:hypothetical protein Ae201684_000967 [Aphanomyces euteiches]KAH9099456.1 hypothetical protein Ae201684P_018471 [Aphanomyces euteiches]
MLKVLASRELLQLTCKFQDGLPLDVRPLKRAFIEAFEARQLFLYGTHAFAYFRCNSEFLQDLDHMLKTFDEWYAINGLSGLPRLVALLPDAEFLAMTYASCVGDVDLFQRICRSSHEMLTFQYLLALASWFQQLSMVKILTTYIPDDLVIRSTLAAVVLGGNAAIVEHLHNHGAQETNLMDTAAKYGHRDVLAFLHEHQVGRCTKAAMDHAADRGHQDIVEFLHHHREEGCSYRAIDMAAANGHDQIVRFLAEHRSEGWSSRAIELARFNGELEIARYLSGRKNPRETGTLPVTTIQ